MVWSTCGFSQGAESMTAKSSIRFSYSQSHISTASGVVRQPPNLRGRFLWSHFNVLPFFEHVRLRETHVSCHVQALGFVAPSNCAAGSCLCARATSGGVPLPLPIGAPTAFPSSGISPIGARTASSYAYILPVEFLGMVEFAAYQILEALPVTA